MTLQTWEAVVVVVDRADEAVVRQQESDATQHETHVDETALVRRLRPACVILATQRRLAESFRRVQIKLHVTGVVLHFDTVCDVTL